MDLNEAVFENELSRLNNELIEAHLEISRLKETLFDMTRKDSLTNVGNRKYLFEMFKELKNRSLRLKYTTTMVTIDINDFKKVNDIMGSKEGDRLLMILAMLLVNRTREGLDYIFRPGGDEFIIIFTNCTEEQATKVISRINKLFMNETTIASLAYGAVEIDFKQINALELHMSMAEEVMFSWKRRKKEGIVKDEI